VAEPFEVPTITGTEPADYSEIETWIMQVRAADDDPDWTRDNIAGLARLSADLRSDISMLEQLVRDVNEFLEDAIDTDRNRNLEAVA
jgi:hypothetical protein